MVVAVFRRVRFIAMWVLLASSVASAQPSQNALAPGAWPGVSLEDLRGMRECALEDPPAVVGQPVTCRPPILSSPAHLSFDAAWVVGLAQQGSDIRGANGGAIAGEYWLTRSLGVGGRFAFVTIDTDHLIEGLAALHYRAFTDEVDRDAFRISLGGGISNQGLVVRAALARDIGYMTGEKSSMTWAWELAAEQAFDMAPLRTYTAGVRGGFELGIRAPSNVDEPDRDPPLRYAIGGEFRASTHLGVGGSFTLPLARILSWRTTAFWTTGHDDAGLHVVRATYAAVTGPRLMLTRGIIAPYVDVQGGPAALPGSPSETFGLLAEAEGGFDFHLGCQTRMDFGGRIQARVDDGLAVRTGFFIMRLEHGRALRHEQGSCEKGTPIARW